MFAILNEITQHQKKPLEYFGENRLYLFEAGQKKEDQDNG